MKTKPAKPKKAKPVELLRGVEYTSQERLASLADHRCLTVAGVIECYDASHARKPWLPYKEYADGWEEGWDKDFKRFALVRSELTPTIIHLAEKEVRRRTQALLLPKEK